MEPDRFLTECDLLRQEAQNVPHEQQNIRFQMWDVIDMMQTWHEEDGYADWFQEKLILFLRESIKEASDGKWTETNRPIH